MEGNQSNHVCERNYEDQFEILCETTDSQYTCGGCSKKLETICLLHEHLLKEFLLGSYLYDHVTRTAYPKQGYATVETQTDADLVSYEVSTNNNFGDLGTDDKNVDLIVNEHKRQTGQTSKIPNRKKRKYVKRKDVHNLDLPVSVLAKKTRSSETGQKAKPKNRFNAKYEKGNVKTEQDDEVVPLAQNTESGGGLVGIYNDCVVKVEADYYDESTDENLDIDNLLEKVAKLSEYTDDILLEKRPAILSKTRSKDSMKVKKHLKENCKKKAFLDAIQVKKVKKKNEESEKIKTTEEISNEPDIKPSVAHSAVPKKRRNGFDKTENDIFKCQHCDGQFRNGKRLNAHLQSIHRCIYPYSCKQCNRKPFQTKEEYVEHKKLHPTQIFHCNLCGKELKSREGLRLHELIHSGEKPYSCTKCDYRGRTSTQLRQHMYNHTDIKTEQCELCGKAFFTKGKLKEHLRYCRKEFSHYCEYCQKGFPTASGLRKHVLMHTGERAFICDVCGFATYRITLLKSHMRTHTGEKPHKCKECGAQLATRGTLLLHLRTHTHEKPFVCSYCNKAFTSKWNLQTHLRQHTGETPYKCDICGQGFKQNVLRKTHMRGHLESTSVEPVGHTQVESSPELHMSTIRVKDSPELSIHGKSNSSEHTEATCGPEARLEPEKSHVNTYVYDRPGNGDILHQAMQSENIHPLDLKLHYSTAEELKNTYNSSVVNSHPMQTNAFEMINYQDIKHV